MGRKFLLALALVFAVLSFLLFTWPAQAQVMELSTVFIPPKGETVPIEVVTPAQGKRDAFQKAEALKHLLLTRQMRPMGARDNTYYLGKCVVEPHQLELGEAVLRVECRSFAMWADDDSVIAIGAPDTAEEALQIIQTFSEMHNKRLKRPTPKPSNRNNRLERWV